jgi:hypothetical protein
MSEWELSPGRNAASFGLMNRTLRLNHYGALGWSVTPEH